MPCPLLLVVYVSELLDLISTYLPDTHTFADDTQLYTLFKVDSQISKDEAIQAVKTCTDAIKQWMTENKLKLNDEKTEISSNQHPAAVRKG